MPEILPFVPPQPAPANTANRPRTEPRSERDAGPDDAPESFADTVEALDRSDPPKDDAETADTDPQAETETPKFAAIPAAPVPQAEPVAQEPEIAPQRRFADLAKATPQLAGKPTADSVPAVKPVATPASQNAQQVAVTEATEVPIPDDAPPTARSVPAAAQLAAQTPKQPVQVATQTPRPPVPTLPKVPAEIEALPDMPETPPKVEDVELSRVERVSARDTAASTQAAKTAMQQGVQLTQTPGMANASTASSEAEPLPIDDVLAAAGQTASATPVAGTTAPGAAPAQIAQQVASQIVTALPRDQGVFVTNAGTEIALDPPELGRVRMIVTEVAGGLALTVTAERQETLDLFKRYAAMLAQEFAQEGFADTNFNFQGEGEAQEGSDGTGPMANPVETDALIAGVQPRPAASGGLDLRL